jgi:hypothetical protein
MDRMIIAAAATLALALVAGGAVPPDPAAFQIPFKFQAGGKSFASGEYRIEMTAEGRLLIRQGSTGRETEVAVIEKLARPDKPAEDPRLVFSMVGNFEPSYTEYVTDYVLTEVWLDGESGYLIKTFKGTYKTHAITGRRADGP